MELPPKHVRFTHTPLDYKNKEIRLLMIEPSTEPSSPIQITIKHVDFSAHANAVACYQEEVATLGSERSRFSRSSCLKEEALSRKYFRELFDYIALSYTWGPESPVRDILVTSPKCQGWLSVRQNLYDFLTIRRDCGSDWLWIDQICINQGKDDERTHQVNQMADIYIAAAVEVWLGSGFEGSDKLMDCIVRESVLSQQEPEPKISVTQQEMHTLIPLLKRFLRIPYWSRLWVMQEIVLGRVVDVRVGSKTSSWKTFYSGWKRLESAFESVDHEQWLETLGAGWRIRYIDKNRRKGYDDWISIWNLIDGTECSDIRDRVFGTMGLVRPSLRILPDYSMQPQDVLLTLLTRVVYVKFAEINDSNDSNSLRKQYRRDCIYVAWHWLRQLEDAKSTIDRKSVRHHLLKILPPDPPKFRSSIGRTWQLKCYLWYEIPDNPRSKRWQLVRAGHVWLRYRYGRILPWFRRVQFKPQARYPQQLASRKGFY
jgi:hypothetical protein